MSIRVVFFGTPAMVVPVLETLTHNEAINVVAVVTQPPKPVGRNEIVTPTPISDAATALKIPVLAFPSLKTSDVSKTLADISADFFVVAAYGKIIPASLLEIPKFGAVNIHPSLLPKYRGASPLQFALADGLTTTGVTIMQMDAGMDTGPILKQWTEAIQADDTAETLGIRLFSKAADALPNVLVKFSQNEIKPVTQNNAEATATKLLEKGDGEIDWNATAISIDAKRRGYTPWPGIHAYLSDGTMMKILDSSAIASCKSMAPGTLHEAGNDVHVATSKGCLKLTTVQLAGKKPMPASDLLRGYRKFFEPPQNQLQGASQNPKDDSSKA